MRVDTYLARKWLGWRATAFNVGGFMLISDIVEGVFKTLFVLVFVYVLLSVSEYKKETDKSNKCSCVQEIIKE